jgi:hypothetical protein
MLTLLSFVARNPPAATALANPSATAADTFSRGVSSLPALSMESKYAAIDVGGA